MELLKFQYLKKYFSKFQILSYTKNTKKQVNQLESLSIVAFQVFIGQQCLSKDFTVQQNNILKNISLDEVNNFAKKCLSYNKMIILIVGDKDKIYSKLLNLGFEVNEINSEGNSLY